MLSATRHQYLDYRYGPLANGIRFATVLILLYLGSAATSVADTSSVTLAWDASTSTNVANYKIYYGTASTNYTQVVSAGLVTQTTITGLALGTTYYFAATACDYVGLESDYSEEVFFSVPAGRPDQNPPGLSLLQAGNQLVLQWPASYSGYTLQWSSSPAGEWTDLTPGASISGDYFTYTETASAAQRYFRLRQ